MQVKKKIKKIIKFVYKVKNSIFKLLYVDILLNKIKVRKLISNKRFREKFIIKTINGFNDKINKKNNNTIRIFSIWEADGRLSMLGYESKFDKQCDFFFIPRSIFNRVFPYLLSDYIKISPGSQMGEKNIETYYSDKFKEARELFRNYCKEVMSFIMKYYEVDAWFLPKLNDDWIIDFIISIKELGIPIGVNDRESHIIPIRMKVYPPILKKYVKDFEVDISCLSNTGSKEFWLKSGYDESKMIMTGRPDSDFWLKKDLWKTRKEIDPRLNNDKFLILFFAFGKSNYMNFYFNNEKRNWDYLGKGFHDIIIELLRKYPDKIQIIYKKSQKAGRDLYSNYSSFKKNVDKISKDNNFLTFDSLYNSLELIQSSDAILAFQTTGLIEAMFTDKPILYGAWGDLFEDLKEYFFRFDKTDALDYLDSKEKLLNKLEYYINVHDKYKISEKMKNARKIFREKYYYNPNGKACKRILDVMKKEVLKWRNEKNIN